MSDRDTTIEELKRKVMAFARERDWQQFHSPKNLAMGLATEAAELMEHFLWCESHDRSGLDDPAKRERISEELADVFIYALEFANMAELDLADAVSGKLRKNALKYPAEKAKGNSLKYTDLQ